MLGNRKWTYGISLATSFVVLCLLFTPWPELDLPSYLSSEVDAQLQVEDEIDPGIFHIGLSFREGGIDPCKAIASAVALGYPSPQLIQARSNDSLTAELDARIAYLSEIGQNRSDDLVLLADGHAIWFQLRPQVLLSRFLASDGDASTVILAGSTYNEDVEDSGSIRADIALGTVESILTLIRQATFVAAAKPELKDVNEVYDYLYQMQQMRKGSKRSYGSEDSDRNVNEAISLFIDEDGDLIYANDPSDAQLVAVSVGASSEPDTRSEHDQQRLLPNDIRTSRPPFWTSEVSDLPRDEVWEDQPLLCRPNTAHIPAVVVRDVEAARDADAEAKQWASTWLAPHLRAMYHSNELLTEGPVAFAGGRFWWPNRPADLKFRMSSPGSWTVEKDIYQICGSMFEFNDVTEPTLPGEE